MSRIGQSPVSIKENVELIFYFWRVYFWKNCMKFPMPQNKDLLHEKSWLLQNYIFFSYKNSKNPIGK